MSYKQINTKGDLPALEREIQEFWKSNETYSKRVKLQEGRKLWSFIDGPITANNPMGVHHAWGRAYKDLWARYKFMRGYEVRNQNGFDCQGLWIEVEVEKELGFKSKRDIEKYGIAEFVKKCIELDHHSFIVKDGKLYGVINLEELSEIPKKFWSKIRIGEVAKVVGSLDYSENAYNALRKMQNLEVDILPVKKGKKIVGVLHESALMNIARIRLLEEKLEG